MRKPARALVPLAGATIGALLTALLAAPAGAAAPQYAHYGCADNTTFTTCVSVNPAPAIIGQVTVDHPGYWSACSITLTVFEPGGGGTPVSSGPVNCLTTSAWASTPAVLGHTYVACFSGTLDYRQVSGCSPYQLAQP
ncbi:hypothetical protein [Dactylosporangium salmoneum]|uniref:Secreted protein n=1 Tax=Dactylosporangium salmoneum TaxID=53361 RepID=A0ABN3HAZ8_9ACTN